MKNLVIIPETKSPLIFFSCIYLVLFLVTLYVPVTVYLSDPGFFSITLADLTIYATTTMAIGLAAAAAIYFPVNETIKAKLTFVVTCLTVFALFNILVQLRDYGSIDSYFLNNEEELFGRRLLFAYDIGLAALIYVAVRALNTKDMITANQGLFPLVAIVLTLFVSFNGMTSNITYKDQDAVLSGSNLPEYNDVLNSYSKDEQNIVVIMLDMFTSAHLEDIFTLYPELEKEFSGFTWYSNTTNSGSATFLSEPSIHGGYEYTVEAINARSDEIDSIVDEIARGYQIFNDHFGAKGFAISLYGTQHTDCDQIAKHVNTDYLKVCEEYESEYDYFSYFAEANNFSADLAEINDNAFLQAYALMSISPYIVRPSIYGRGTWLGIIERDGYTKKQYGQYSHLASLASISNTDSEQPTFKYLQSESAHKPWYIDENLQLTLDDPYPDTEGQTTKVDGLIPEHLYAEAYTIKVLAEWIRWLKAQGIYDNTMIVLSSDHGHYDNPRLAEAFGVDVKGQRPYSENVDYPGRPSGLLFIKDFDADGEPKESTQFMSTADIPAIVCSAIGGCDGILSDPRGTKTDRSFYYSIGDAKESSHSENKFNIDELYEINTSIYDKENWKKIE